jgi:Trk K+ transport system NAD-binding subunit
VGRVARPDTLLAAGDQVVAIAEPGRESDLIEIFAGD